ncbi:hypothetical protein ACSBOB_32150 [Mesorhizobium sp. ASY16-5R]
MEYGVLQALAEGFALMQHKKGLDIPAIIKLWNGGSVMGSLNSPERP